MSLIEVVTREQLMFFARLSVKGTRGLSHCSVSRGENSPAQTSVGNSGQVNEGVQSPGRGGRTPGAGGPCGSLRHLPSPSPVTYSQQL